jgi:phosphatidylserine decarboxylase
MPCIRARHPKRSLVSASRSDGNVLESWLAGHRERAEARAEQVVLHPVLIEFQELVDTDPVVRMYLDQMVAQVPSAKPYRKRHLESVQQIQPHQDWSK